MPLAATWMQLEILILRQVKSERQIPYGITYMLNLKFGTNEPIYTTETLTDMDRLVVAGGGGGWEFGVSRCALLHLGWMNDEVLLYHTGNNIHLLG